MAQLRLIVGLGNPGAQYERTRHNVGADWVRRLAADYQIPLSSESKFKGEVGRGLIAGVDLRLLIPTTYMNLSGEAVGAIARFYKIAPSELLIAYDEMAFAPGLVRFKQGGGDNGHNGLKSVRAGLGTGDYPRMRMGVGHPGHKSLVTAYLTGQKMPVEEARQVEEATWFPAAVVEDLVHGRWQQVMNVVHLDGKSAAQNDDKHDDEKDAKKDDKGDGREQTSEE
ncbi:MAG: aminoacyl-tRNA hydrolase [Pseudomonadota bacterium]